VNELTEVREESPAEDALRALACWLGVGGYNAPTVDAEVFKRKIMAGVSMLAEGVPDALRYRALRELGAAPSDWRGLTEGLVLRFTNLDEHCDAWLRARGKLPPPSTPKQGEGE
jgi:hypothetical protein